MNICSKLGIKESSLILAPLAGVSDIPFRRVCQMKGADLTYVEMLSATAIKYENERTFEMMNRHADEKILGVQVTSRNPEEMATAVETLDKKDFDTIDLNMGCPVKKIVKTGCGSAILKDLDRLAKTVEAARKSTKKPLSVKIRLGWDTPTRNYIDVAKIIEENGADWMTVHGRTRNDDYSVPVDLMAIRELKESVSIPVIGNGNLMSQADCDHMKKATNVDSFMIARGSLGNPWIFSERRPDYKGVSLDEWFETVNTHLALQQETFRNQAAATVCMRKHLLWYVKGWPGAKEVRNRITQVQDLKEAIHIISDFKDKLFSEGILLRASVADPHDPTQRFLWDPKFDMDRKLDRGAPCLETESPSLN